MQRALDVEPTSEYIKNAIVNYYEASTGMMNV